MLDDLAQRLFRANPLMTGWCRPARTQAHTFQRARSLARSLSAHHSRKCCLKKRSKFKCAHRVLQLAIEQFSWRRYNIAIVKRTAQSPARLNAN